ncbi:MAG: hypothetical protein K2P86_09650 [Xanthobacteraceae bacterium]|jgi:hypothetical protein|nr:hypothetical protein [Xanthobacteraceae bacterium]
MRYGIKAASEKMSECRALVPLTVSVSERGTAVHYRPDAAFVTQLSANVKGFSLYRAKRRVQPEVGAKNYRTTIADALACQPKGRRLNYCA